MLDKTFDFVKNLTHWIFDLDGTLTVAAHDFDAIREQLGLPKNRPILEELENYPPQKAKALFKELEAIEQKIAMDTKDQPGASQLLQKLTDRGIVLGIVTRNSLPNTTITLKQAGLLNFFSKESIISRNCCLPKPDPQGINLLLSRWQAPPQKTVMVGDYKFDLLAGRSAGVKTICLDVTGTRLWYDYADLSVDTLHALSALL